MEHWAKMLLVRFWKDCLLAELQAKTARGCRFLLFQHHSYEVTLICPPSVLFFLAMGIEDHQNQVENLMGLISVLREVIDRWRLLQGSYIPVLTCLQTFHPTPAPQRVSSQAHPSFQHLNMNRRGYWQQKVHITLNDFLSAPILFTLYLMTYP